MPQPQPSPQQTVTHGAVPIQNDVLFTAVSGAVLCGALGIIGGDLFYDLIHALDPAATAYPSILILRSLPAVWRAFVDITRGDFPEAGVVYFPLIGATMGGLVGTFLGIKWGWMQTELHVSGPRQVEVRNIKPMSRRDAAGVKIGPLLLSRAEETKGIVVIGKSGSGKTTLITPIAEQAIERGDNVLIVDFKGDYRKRFGQDSALIAPWSPDSARWQLGKDITDEGDAEAFAEAAVPESDDPLWSGAARGILSGLTMDLQERQGTQWGWGDLAAQLMLLGKDPIEIQKAIEQHRPLIAARIVLMPDETRESIYTNISVFGESIISIARREAKLPQKYWSVADWIDGKSPIAIVGWNAAQEALSKRVALPILKLAIQRLISDRTEERSPDEAGFWFFIDECGQLGEIPGFISALTAIRSKGGRMVAGFQTFGQIGDVYGDAGRAITGTETRLLGKLEDADDQKEAADMCGERKVKRLSVTTTRDGARTESWQTTSEAVYDKSNFSSLGVTDNGVKLLYIGRGNVAEIELPFLPKV
jgi:type IV secretory pathway TraG/TraD family ATPase VirD4